MFLTYYERLLSGSLTSPPRSYTLMCLCVSVISMLFVSCAQHELRPEMVIVRSADDVLPLDSIAVKPVVYDNEMDFSQLPVEEKKKKFISMILPEVLMVRHNILLRRRRIGHIIYKASEGLDISPADSSLMNYYLNRLKAKTWEEVYRKMAVHPTSIVIAQAAVESGWGSSRFFNEGNNLFGVWSYNEEDARMEASQGRETGAVFVRSYGTIGESIEDYFFTLARGRAYTNFRHARVKEKDPYQLIFHLKSYSERGYNYINQLSMVMRQNNLVQYDGYQLNSAYLEENSLVVY